MAREYTSKDIQSIREDRLRVRKRPQMYLPGAHKDGCVHIIFEIVDNSIDELSIDQSLGKTLTITFDTKTREVTVTDDGRGIPHESLLDAYTVLNTSGKFDNGEDTAYVTSGGTYGIGSKLAVFLSKTCEVTSFREGKSLTYQFVDGVLTNTIKGKSKNHGTTTKFTIDNKLMDMDDVEPEDIRARLYEKSFCFPDIDMTLVILNNGEEVKTYNFKGNTLLDLVKKWKPDTDIIHINTTRKVRLLKRIDDDDITEVKVDVEAAVAFKWEALEKDTDTFVISYANSIKTYDGGQHVDGLKQGLVKYFKEIYIPKMSKKDKDLPIMPSDITAGLCGMVSVKLSRPEFSAQHKSRLLNQEVKFAVRDAVYEALCNQKNGVINDLGDFIKKVVKGRMASKKVRVKDTDNAFSKDKPDKYVPIIYNMKTVSPELIICEGDSVLGLATSARDPYNQAIYTCRKPKNIFDDDSETIMTAAVNNFNEIMNVSGIEPGKRCDPSKCVFHHILICTDADIDGDGIAITVAGLFAKHCRPLVDAGMIGRILPPLYSFMEGKKKKFVQSKRKFFEYLTERFLADTTVTFRGKAMSKKQLAEFLEVNSDYDTKLNKITEYYCCDPRLMEYIIWKYHDKSESQKKSYWMAALKQYKDLRILIENGRVVIDGELPGSDYVNLDLDEHFDHRIRKFKAIQAVNHQIDGFTINGSDGKTIYDVMTKFRNYIPKDVKYYKGLGELTPKEMKALCMDPENRTVIILKFKNYEQDMQKLSVILSTKAEYADIRMRVMSHTVLSDIDLVT
ncbi:MAG: ATP-binding protein [Ruminococcus flavefaciens]|nr:ATP-binding protein [Ruminococcus flavefaciens]